MLRDCLTNGFLEAFSWKITHYTNPRGVTGKLDWIHMFYSGYTIPPQLNDSMIAKADYNGANQGRNYAIKLKACLDGLLLKELRRLFPSIDSLVDHPDTWRAIVQQSLWKTRL